ncbi:hypothetical protein [Erythrobacter aureus]|uniref:Uncharacterized protein n=1 Tax=Erythrobacter aureus TaxID=2182384 RepID=A0A345YIQ8_9SPHN|nr:hypothetical protein [Erythrobacter aureus]AXK43810.1 hypothetical protein DVR09_15250 [Erythrobacter aureus]
MPSPYTPRLGNFVTKLLIGEKVPARVPGSRRTFSTGAVGFENTRFEREDGVVFHETVIAESHVAHALRGHLLPGREVEVEARFYWCQMKILGLPRAA